MSEACEFPEKNATTEQIRQILNQAKTIAVVGISDNPDRPSYRVAAYLKDHGYHIFPVNPKLERVLGEKCFASLADIPEPVDIVDIFRKPEFVTPLVKEAIDLKAKTIWMQEGIVNNDAANLARKAGLQVVMNKCLLKEHLRLQR